MGAHGFQKRNATFTQHELTTSHNVQIRQPQIMTRMRTQLCLSTAEEGPQ